MTNTHCNLEKDNANMRFAVKGKVRYLFLGVLVLVASWLGYWIGYLSSHHHHSSSLARLQSQVNTLVQDQQNQRYRPPLNTQHLDTNPYIGGVQHGDNEPTGQGRVGNTRVHIFGPRGKPNEAQNRVNEVNARDHALGLHEGHASQISQHLNVRKDPLKGIHSQSIRTSKDTTTKLTGGLNSMRELNNGRHAEGEDLNKIQTDLEPWQRIRSARDRNELPRTNVNSEVRNGQAGVGEGQPTVGAEEYKRLVSMLKRKDPVGTQRLPPRRTKVETSSRQPVRSGGREYYAVIHAGTGSRVHGQMHAHLQAMPDTVSPDAYVFKSRSLPKSPRLRPSIANGHLGTAVHAGEVFMNGLYNGRGEDSHRAVIPSTVSFNITGTEPPSNFTRIYTLNAGEGIYSEVSESKMYTLTQRIYAHRKYSRLLVVEVDITRTDTTPLKLKVKLNKWTASYDITFLKHDSMIDEVSYKQGHINTPETDDSERTNVHIFYDHVPDELVPPSGSTRTKWVFLTSMARTKEDALEAYKKGAQLAQSSDQLYAEHVKTWASVWAAGRVDIVGNLPLARKVYGAYYYLLSSMPLSEDSASPYIGLSPTGLPFGEKKMDYQGYVFWDQEIWMYPAILPFFPSLARILLGSRVRTMAAAADNARIHGNQGLQFPWSSAFTGVEVSSSKACSEREIHVSAAVSFAVLNYLYATNDTSVLSEEQKMAYLLTGVANFWANRLSWNKTKDKYEIRGVMPPDEYQKNVNNSAYTNYIAKIALLAPEHAFKLINKTMDRWRHYADNLYLPFDSHLKYHPEYDGYQEGTKVKQADAILLGYPLLTNMLREVRRKDLKVYEKVTDIGGPAMSWSMFTIGWLELGDEARAESMFKRSTQYVRNEFQVWHETLFGPGATNFLTGMGGFLQAVVNGYGGLRLRQDRLDFNFILPLDSTQMNFIGLNYLGYAFNIFADKEFVLINLTEKSVGAPELLLFVYKTEELHSLQLNKAVRIARQPATIVAKDRPLPSPL